MPMDFGKVLALIRAMNDRGVEYVVFGAVALGAHGIVRATTDIDFFVHPTEKNIALLREALRSIWNDPEIEEITARDLAGDYPAIEYGPPGEDFSIDIVSRLGEAYRYEGLESEVIVIEDVPVRVVTGRVLYEMKKGTVRVKDRLDAEAIRDKFGFD